MRGIVQRIGAAWQGYWFCPESPLALAMGRIFFFGMLLYWYAGTDLTFCPVLAKIYWHPISYYLLLNRHGPPPAEWLYGMEIVWKISLVTSLLGLFSRTSTLVAAGLGIYLIALPFNLGKNAHALAVPSICLAVMALARCGQCCSVDAWMARRRGRPFSTVPDAEYRWPVQLMRVLICLVFLSAGANKLAWSGLEWATSETLQMQLLHLGTPLGLWLARHALLCHLMAAFTLVVEFLHPLSLLSPRLALLWVPAGASLLTGIYLMMHINFLPLIVLHVFWVPWSFLREKLWLSSPGKTLR